ncbi:MAG: YciI family protein [Xanthobacteraceae bacterium]
MTMRFLMLYRPADTEKTEAGAPPSKERIAEMGKFIEEMTKAGVLVATEGCQPTRKGARGRLSNGKLTVTDGPFAESKELIAGFALAEAKSKEEAIEWAKRFLKVAGDGESEIRQLWELSDFSPDVLPAEEAAREQALRAEMQRKAAAR